MNSRLPFLAVAVLAWGCVLPPATAAESQAGEAFAAGRAIYREGILPSGRPLVGAAQAGVVRSGRDAACLACHRRSGFGTAEGPFVIRPITAPDLYQSRVTAAANPRIAHQLGRPVRPAYDDATLARAIREGVDASGRRLLGVMPRYALDDADMKALTGYLQSLFAQPAPGVTPTEVHLATVIQPDVPADRRRVMLDVLQAFVREKNAGVRSEEARRTAGTMRMFRAYRKWVLHVWDLAGPPDTWPAQLEENHRRQPVFALVAGLGAADWRPIHAFSERFEVPCVLPLTDLPALRDGDFYTVYFSRGISLEADALAQYLGPRAGAGRIVQVYRPGTAGAVAARAFRSALPEAERRIQDRPMAGRPDEAFWQDLSRAAPDQLVLWLGPEDAAGARLVAAAGDAPAMYLSTTLLGGDVAAAPPQASLTYPWEVPSQREASVLRSKLWLRTRGLEPPDEQGRAVAVHTLFALTVAGEALMHLQDSYSRDYFVERVEHAITTTITPTFYPRVSLGPGKRFASKGAYIVQVQGGSRPGLTPVSGWIVP